MGAPKNRGYKRSWKNYLLDAKYQLRFTLFLVGVAAVLFAGLGFWVSNVARDATLTAINNVLSYECQEPETRRAPVLIEETSLDVPGEVDGEDTGEGPQGEGEVEGEGDSSDEGAGDERERSRPSVTIDDVGVDDGARELGAAVEAPGYDADAMARYHLCKLRRRSTIDALRDGERTITVAMVLAGIALCAFLVLYGIKMTHGVAGPLFKVGTYLDKMKQGRFDEVYNLRKGDQLVSFYEHFKEAHAGLARVSEQDREVLARVVAAADESGLADKGPEVKQAIEELRAVVKRKEDANG